MYSKHRYKSDMKHEGTSRAWPSRQIRNWRCSHVSLITPEAHRVWEAPLISGHIGECPGGTICVNSEFGEPGECESQSRRDDITFGNMMNL